MNPILNTALTFANSNFKVFPLKNNTKSGQVLKSWKEEATTDITQINKWFNDTDYNVGIRTGNGLIVIDVDCKNDKDGKKSIKDFLKKFPKTKVIKTPNNGYHIYYLVDREIPCRVNLLEGIDIRGEGGYVVGAGSIVDDKEYTVNFEDGIAAANEAVYEFLNIKTNTPYNALNLSVIGEGGRNDYLFRIACFLQQKGLNDETISVCIHKENEMKCNPPLSNEEVDTIVNSSIRYRKGYIEMANKSNYEGRYTVEDLLNSDDEIKPDIIEDLLVVGLNFIGAAQKNGKTFFCIQLCDAVTDGKKFMGKKTTKGTCMYLALEDKKANLTRRLRRMKIKKKKNFVIDTIKPNPNYDVEARIIKELEVNPDLKVVVIDTFAKIRKNKDHDYETEYEEATMYHELANKYNLAIILVTHLKKEIDPNHPFDAIYGTRGLTAGADSIIVMYKKNHLSKARQLAIQGKDIPDSEMTLIQNENLCFEVAETEIDEDLDDNLIKVVNYIVKAKEFTGSHEELCSKLSLSIRGKGLQILLTSNKILLEDSFISYEKLPRSNKARRICLKYLGDEKL